MSAEKNVPPKRKWEKPEVRVIELAAEEVMAVGCKHARARASGGRVACGLGARCVVKGS